MSIKTEFDKLIAAYHSLLTSAHTALAPGKTQQQRNQARDALGGYLNEANVIKQTTNPQPAKPQKPDRPVPPARS